MHKAEAQEKYDRFYVMGLLEPTDGFFELYFTLNRADFPSTIIYRGQVNFETLKLEGASHASLMSLTRVSDILKILPHSSGVKTTDRLSASDTLGSRARLAEALRAEAPVFTGPFSGFLSSTTASAGLIGGSSSGEEDLSGAVFPDTSGLSGTWAGHFSKFSTKETTALTECNMSFKVESQQLGFILAKGLRNHKNGSHPVVIRGSFSPFLQFGFIWAHVTVSIYGPVVQSSHFVAKIDTGSKTIEGYDQNGTLYLAKEADGSPPEQKGSESTSQTLGKSGSTSSTDRTAGSLTGEAGSQQNYRPQHASFDTPQAIPFSQPISYDDQSTWGYQPQTSSHVFLGPSTSGAISGHTSYYGSHRKQGDSRVDIHTSSVGPIVSSFSHMQLAPTTSSVPFSSPDPHFDPRSGIIGNPHPSRVSESHGSVFHALPVTTPDSSAIPMALQIPLPSHPGMLPPDKSPSPRTNPHHILQTLRERPPSPMSIIPEATPELPQAPHINKTFLTKEGTLKAPIANVEDDLNRQPRRLSAARASLTVSMYTMPRWLTLPLYLRCLVAPNSKHPYPYTHPSQLHPATRRRRKSSEDSTSPTSGSTRRASVSSRLEKRDERRASRKKNRWIGKQKSQASPQRA
jgi:hypothetical protein